MHGPGPGRKTRYARGMRTFWAVAIAVVLGAGGVARADDAAKRVKAIDALLKHQVELWRNGNGTDDIAPFAATLTDDGRIARNGDWLRPDLMLSPPYNISKLAITKKQIGWSKTWGWVVAEIKLTSRMYAEPEGAGNPHPRPERETYRWIELVVADGDAVKGRAIGVYKAMSDGELADLNVVQALPTLASPPANLALLANLEGLPARLAKDAATSVTGTSAGELGLGVAAAKKLAGGWGKVGLELVGPAKDARDPKFYTPIELTAGDAIVVWGRARMKLAKHPRGYLLDVFGILRKTATGVEVVAASYAGS